MAFVGHNSSLLLLLLGTSFVLLASVAVNGEDFFHEWRVAIDTTIKPVLANQPVITINGMFPGPLINASTNDDIHINVFNDMDEPVLFTWNGIQQRLNSWQDGVSGTNCPIQPGKNWTYLFQMKDQIGSFFYFPSLYFQKAGGGFGPIRINNRIVINVPFPKPAAEHDLLIGDWYQTSYKEVRSMIRNGSTNLGPPDKMLINGKGPYLDPSTKSYESFTFTSGKTYRLRISNVGSVWNFNFRIQNHKMLLVETEGSYTNQTTFESLDVHVGQSYSVLVTADQKAADYYIVAAPKMVNADIINSVTAVGILHYANSTTNATGPLPIGPDPFDLQFSINQAKSIRWNMTTGAARPNPQGTFNVTNVTLSQTFILHGSKAEIDGESFYTVNDVSYTTPTTPLKLADHFGDRSGVFELDQFSTNSSNGIPKHGVFVSSGNHKGWLEIVFKNNLDVMDSWHLDGFGFFVVGYGEGEWRNQSRSTYNIYDPVVRSTVQVYPKAWSAVYAYLDNPGMWNLRSQNLRNWYLGQELYIRVYDADPDPAKERPPPANLLFCGKFSSPPPSPAPAPNAPAFPPPPAPAPAPNAPAFPPPPAALTPPPNASPLPPPPPTAPNANASPPPPAALTPPPNASPPPPSTVPTSLALSRQISWFQNIMMVIIAFLCIGQQ